MSKIHATLHGTPITQQEDEHLNRWKYLQNYSREIVKHAIEMVQTTGLAKLSAEMKLQAAVKDFTRLGGKPEDLKFL